MRYTPADRTSDAMRLNEIYRRLGALEVEIGWLKTEPRPPSRPILVISGVLLLLMAFGAAMYLIGRDVGTERIQHVTVTLPPEIHQAIRAAAAADADRPPPTPFTAGPGGAGTLSLPQGPGPAQNSTQNPVQNPVQNPARPGGQAGAGGPGPAAPKANPMGAFFPNAVSPPGHEGTPAAPGRPRLPTSRMAPEAPAAGPAPDRGGAPVEETQGRPKPSPFAIPGIDGG